MKNIIIAFSGKAQSGKTQSADLLKEIVETTNDLHFRKLSFATAVKEIAKYYFEWNGDKGLYRLPNLPNEDHYTPPLIQDKGRQLLINIGSGFREIRPTIWADIIMKTIKELDVGKPENVVYCIDDMRFLNEVNVLNAYGRTHLIRVNRPNGQLDIDDVTERELDGHKFEHKIENDKTLVDLKSKVAEVYREITKK